jgi:hypothetical protein
MQVASWAAIPVLLHHFIALRDYVAAIAAMINRELTRLFAVLEQLGYTPTIRHRTRAMAER